MRVSEQPVKSLGSFVERVSSLRESWAVPGHKELWFRGEGRDYGATMLRPKLYRPSAEGARIAVPELLQEESHLYEGFREMVIDRCKLFNKINLLEEDRNYGWDWDWDWGPYFEQHECAPTRLLNWTDGSLRALDFALRNRADDDYEARVYVLEPQRLSRRLNQLSELKKLEADWKEHVAEHPDDGYTENRWQDAYLPVEGEEGLEDMPMPEPPLVMDFPLIACGIAAQRGRFIAFGTEPNWLSDEFGKPDSTIRAIAIAKDARARLRQELRDCGVEKTLVYPDWTVWKVWKQE